jgi:hypothetical protein
VKKIVEPQREISVLDETDVLVAGGGPAGFAAAVSAARTGLKVVIVERYGILGGLATGGLVIAFVETDRYDFGICREIICRLEHMNAVRRKPRPRGISPSWVEGTSMSGEEIIEFDPESFKLTTFEMIGEEGVTLYLHCLITGVFTEDDEIKGLIIESKSGRHAILGKILIDATGDGDVCAAAGASFSEDKHPWGINLDFRIGGVDSKKALEWQHSCPNSYRKVIEELKKSNCEITWFVGTRDDIIWGYSPRFYEANGLISRDLSTVEHEARKKIFEALEYFQLNMPGFENAYLIDTASQIGVRETRKIKGEYTLTKEDVLTGREFKDVIARGLFDVPYGCLVPRDIDSVLTAGRCISITHEAHGNIRNIPPCIATGQAAGAAAALAVYDALKPRAIDLKKLQRTLLNQDVHLGSKKRLETLRLT